MMTCESRKVSVHDNKSELYVLLVVGVVLYGCYDCVVYVGVGWLCEYVEIVHVTVDHEENDMGRLELLSC